MSVRRTSQASEHHFRELLQNLPTVAVQGYDSQGITRYWNAASELLYGYSAEEAIGTSLLDLIIPDEMHAGVRAAIAKMFADKAALPLEQLELRRKDGSRVSVYSSHYYSQAKDGSELLFCIDVDLTELKRGQHQLLVSEERFRSLIETIPDAIFFKDGESRWRIINHAAEALFQVNQFEWFGKTDLEMAAERPMFKWVHETCHQDDESAWAAGRTMLFTESTVGLDKELRYFDVFKTPLFEDDGRRKAMVVIAQDVTERKKAESELRIAAAAFESQQGTFVTDADWVILRVNHAFTQITGYSAEEAVGQTPKLLRSGRHPDAHFVNMRETLERTGSWQGELWDRRKNGEIYPIALTISAVRDAQGAVTHYVDAFTDITARIAAQDQIENLAFFDPLTGLPNRRLLMDRLTQACASCLRRGARGALLFVDLDHFKFLNDTHGHHLGDLLLQQVAQRLLACVRDGDTIARLGGDEFVVMLQYLPQNDLEAATEAELTGERIRHALGQHYALGSQSHHSTASIGITLFGDIDESINEPLKRADLAMYQAKAAGRNRIRFFDPQMQANVSKRASMESALREALSRQEFKLHYQPQLSHGQPPFAVEALLRWKHPERGLISPTEFVPLAEETGLILPLGAWVLDTACEQLAAWAEHPKLERLSIAVNVSPLQFAQLDFVDGVRRALKRTGARAKLLKIELTESVLVANVELIIAKMLELRALGVSFALDDFGTGYSSLSHLKRLPLDQLKIDQSFVRDILHDPNDAAIAKMIIALGESMNLSVIAEGVETVAQADFLASLGCHAYQGFLFSEALPIELFERRFGMQTQLVLA